MKERLRQDLERAFEAAPRTQRNQELKEEILANLYDKYDACLASDMTPEQAYRETANSIGDLSSLFDRGAEDPAPPSNEEKWKKARKVILWVTLGYWLGAAALYTLGGLFLNAWISGLLLFLYAGLLYGILHGVWRLVSTKKRGGPIVKIVLCSLFLMIFLSPALFFDGNGFRFSVGTALLYEDQDYSKGNAELSPEQTVSSLNIEWISGTVTVKLWDEDHVSVFEESSSPLSDEDQLRYRYVEGVLSIKYSPSRIYRFGNHPRKNLTLCLPRGTELDRITVDSISAEVHLSELGATNAALSTVSGELFAENCHFGDLSADSVSGEILLYLTNTPRDLDIDTVSGDTVLILPADTAGFAIEVDTVSGDLDLPEECHRRDDEIYYGNRSAEFGFDSVSGDLTVRFSELAES